MRKVSPGNRRRPIVAEAHLLRGGIGVTATRLNHLLDNLCVDLAATYALHHCQMLQVIMCLEQRIPSEKLHQDAANTPDIARETPSEIKDNFRGPVMSRRDHRRMIFVVKCGGAEIY